MEPIIEQAHKLLLKKQKTIAVAESCTGGLASYLLSRLSGSSKYFILGIVAYSNKAKTKILKIPAALIAKNGAVSSPVASRMALNIRKIANADFGIGITGIAGPTAGTPLKPVGTVFIAIDTKSRKICKKFIFIGNRGIIQKKTSLKALEILKNWL
jgi:nicotinamide-nucleotide amidase